MAVLNNGLQLKGIGADATQMIKGLVLLVAVAFDVYNKSQGRVSLLGMLTRNFRRGGSDDDSSALPPPSAATETTSVSETIRQSS
jgi:putative multiple sugar transport system permease protein